MTRRPLAPTRLALALVVCAPVLAWAQTPAGNRPPSKWELEFHGGGVIAGGSTGGATSALPNGEAFTTGAGFPSLRVSSWLFGDGAALFNSATQLAGRAERISPLDAMLTTTSATRRSGASVGFRVSRVLTARFAAEFSLDYTTSGLRMTDASAAQVEATRQSFVTAFNGLFGSSPAVFGNRTTTATSNVKKSAGARLFVSGGARMHLSNGARHPYLVGGVAIARDTGGGSSATINGHYKFTVNAALPPFTIDESDDLTIRYTSKSAILGMIGVGFDAKSWARSGIRVDARVFLGNDTVDTVIDAHGTPHDSDPAGAVFTFTSPGIQWSSNQQTLGRSSLSGTVNGFTTLSGAHVQAPVVVTVGYFLRF